MDSYDFDTQAVRAGIARSQFNEHSARPNGINHDQLARVFCLRRNHTNAPSQTINAVFQVAMMRDHASSLHVAAL